jgi:hypothetical protein
MLVFRKGQWQTVEIPLDPMLSYAHRQRLAACLGAGKKEEEFYQELFPALRYNHESFGKSIALQSTIKNKPV